MEKLILALSFTSFSHSTLVDTITITGALEIREDRK
jgi:hypothetical protein